MQEAITKAVKELLAVVKELHEAYPKKPFTLDGRLVGDIGEALAEHLYQLEVFDRLERHHDARTPDGRLVQIKATMKTNLTFPAGHVPDYYLGLQIDRNGVATEVFNGPAKLIHESLKGRAHPKNNLHSVSVNSLKALSEKVPDQDRIRRR